MARYHEGPLLTIRLIYCKSSPTYLVLILISEERLGEDVDKFGEVLKVLCHLGGQYHVDDALSNDFVALAVHA